MELFGPSLIYSVSGLLGFFPPEPIGRQDLVREDSPSLYGMRLDTVLEVLGNCGFMFQDATAQLHLTARGQIVAASSTEIASREIVLAIVERYRPPWTRLMSKGRNECLP